jgi:hypothetical protein
VESDPENDDITYVLIGGPCCGDGPALGCGGSRPPRVTLPGAGD